MDTIKKPSLWFGALIGALLTMTLTSVLFLADQLAGLPFIPFDVFDFVSRNLPGPLLTFGIDVMVDIIIAFNMGETSVAAKSAEQLMGLVAFLVLGTIANVGLYAVLNRSKSSARNLYPGMVFWLGIRRHHDVGLIADQLDGDRGNARASGVDIVQLHVVGSSRQLDL